MNEIKTPYLNLQTDFGFKQVFGNKANKQALIRFLNILFDGKLTVKDVTFHDKEVLPSEQDGKRIIYDVYCTSNILRSESPFYIRQQAHGDKKNATDDHHFILEMQNIYTPPFEERIVFYASRMVAGQGHSGWDYEIEPVFAVAVTDFNLSHLSPKLVRDVMLVDRESGEPLTDKLHILLCSLKEIPSKWENCSTEMERMLFLIKNMDKMDSTSLAYREGNFTEIFEAARSSRLRKDEMIAYSQSLEKLRDTQRGIQYAAEQASAEARAKGLAEGRAEGRAKGLAEGRAEGRAEGHAEGRAEGRAEEKIEIARKMIESGIATETISLITGLSISEISNI